MLIIVLVFALFSCCVLGLFGGCVGAQISFDDTNSLDSTNLSTTVTLSSQEVIASYSPAKILQIVDERGPSYKQSYPYLQKSRTLNASAIVSSTIGVGGVRFIVDQGRTGETIIDDTNTSDTVFRAQFYRLSYGNHSLNITILNESLDPLSGAGQTVDIDPFWILTYLIQFVGDSITISYADVTNGPVYELADAESDGNAVTSANLLELPCYDNDIYQRCYCNGIHIFFSDYVNAFYGTWIYSNNEARSGITAAGTHTKFVDNNYGFADRFTSLAGNSSTADLFGPTHAYVMLGLNDRHHNVPEATYESELTNVVNDIHNQGIPYENITLLYPTYSPGSWDVFNYLDNIDAVSSNLGTRLITDLYNETKANFNSGKSWYHTDNLHFNRGGSQNISRILAEKSTWLSTGEAIYTEFGGPETTDFNTLPDITNVSNATLQTETAKITWYNIVNAYGADFDTNVDFGFAFVYVNAPGLNSTFNASANVSLYNLPWSETPAIFVDGSPCQDCPINFYSLGTLSFNVAQFSNYSARANAELSIWDDSDTQPRVPGEDIAFAANYRTTTADEPINGSGVYCSICFNVTPNGPFSMTFNSTSLMYVYNRTFNRSGTFSWYVTCNGSAWGYEVVNATDTVTITPTNNPPVIRLNYPPDGLATSNNWVILNATVADADNDSMTVYFYANNNSAGLNASEGLVYSADEVANGTTLTYNLTALPLKPSEEGLVILMHFNDSNISKVYNASLSDNFNDNSLDPKWKILRNDGMWNESLQTLRITTNGGDFYQATNTAPLFWQCINSSKDYEITVDVNATPDTNWEQGGIFFYHDDDNYVRFTYIYYVPGVSVVLSKEVSQLFSDVASNSCPDGGVTLKLRKVGTDYSAYYFTDGGATYSYVGSTTTAITASKIGLSVFNHAGKLFVFDNFDVYDLLTNVEDSSNVGNNGTNFGANATGSGKFNGGFLFDGHGDYVSVMDAVDPTAYTISAWVKPEDVASVNIIVRASSSGPTSAWSNQLRITSGSTFQHYLNDSSAQTVTGSTTAVAGNWYYVAAVANNNGDMRLYVNGVEEGTNRTIGTLWTGGDSWYIGSNSGDSMGYFNGTIDKVAIYNRSLSASEILSHYRLGAGRYYWNVYASDSAGNTNRTEIRRASGSRPILSPLINQFIIFTPFSDNFCYSYLKLFCTHLW